MIEPLSYFDSEIPFNPDLIQKIYRGEIYTLVELKNGNIGLCANLHNESLLDINHEFDLSNLSHRIIIQAYYNAIFNYQNHIFSHEDIVSIVRAKKYSYIAMIGYFSPIYEQLLNYKINVKVFDDFKSESFIQSDANKEKVLQNADCVILTATSIFNNTFDEITKMCQVNQCDIHIIGPSTPLTETLFKFQNVKYLHGITINDKTSIIKEITNNNGTRSFIKYCNKVCLKF